MSQPTTSSTATARAKPATRRNALPGRLSPGMACDTAFRIIARRHLGAVLAQHDGTCRGDPDALHQIRIALTHLRTAIRFFSPMVDDTLRPNVWAELKWLNSQLGLVRDLDVAIERVVAESGDELAVIAELQHWDEKRAESHRLLVRALQSARYKRLVEQTSAWIESGPWSTRRSKEAVRLRRCSLADHATARLTEWEETLLRKARKLRKLDVEKRHRLRLLNKRLTYSIESLTDLFDDDSLAKQKSILKQLRKAQRSLGQLNDDARGQALAASLNGAGPEAGIRFLDRKREKRLLRTASTAYRKLDKAKPFRSSDLAPNAEPKD
ncbi:UNVERIFIED_ORG: CHAD domain-containing protein [Bradyrhizobium japonicum]|jgi:CHAD domain-containing protein|uniref:CHAD domain-containing protein n=1 Tax=Bradyrhizobium diazoefficiens TaxID=1355477 RepID=A0A809X8L7_9BRAD|nr:CHAD domain-containing protein [Bradyrhizobium diazoefficiens]WLA76764.1 CHAD domain-containing protein [Bradyrhizobium diazoefficiens]BCE23886.1 CHAD domain-containing protein [Bradyrhizobium diazoefficiens]BCE50145.1 CHAD domain-containing protein [Bradyrhizobium diazoefficiens]BCE93651.1 CHAD domain-containing protein [Bradyrhizobium diazoefficiens]BCF28588.1 CHAD domain-containing protein [Bradyrhizobium diazoefficiens]